MFENQTTLYSAGGYDAPPTSKPHVMHLLAERNVVLGGNYHASRMASASSSDMLCINKKLGKLGKKNTVSLHMQAWLFAVIAVPLAFLLSCHIQQTSDFLMRRRRMTAGRIHQEDCGTPSKAMEIRE